MLDNPVSWWLVMIITSVTFALAAEAGRWIGRKQPEEELDARRGDAGIHSTALLALLGLLLAFSFSIVEIRFNARRMLVLEEANAIGTAYLRADAYADSGIGATMPDS
jgi:hypothetical protein